MKLKIITSCLLFTISATTITSFAKPYLDEDYEDSIQYESYSTNKTTQSDKKDTNNQDFNNQIFQKTQNTTNQIEQPQALQQEVEDEDEIRTKNIQNDEIFTEQKETQLIIVENFNKRDLRTIKLKPQIKTNYSNQDIKINHNSFNKVEEIKQTKPLNQTESVKIDTKNNQENEESLLSKKGAYHIFGGLYYVNPQINSDYKQYKKRVNFFASTSIGAAFAVGNNYTSRGDHFSAPAQIMNPSTYANSILGVNHNVIGFDLILHNFFFSFGVDMYTMFGNPSFHSNFEFFNGIKDESIDPNTMFLTLGYKFQVMIGYVINKPNFPLTKLYIVYRDTQLEKTFFSKKKSQLGTFPNCPNPNDEEQNLFGATFDELYFSRNIGIGAMTEIYKGIDLGTEIIFSLRHSKNRQINIPIIVPSIFLKVNF